MAPLVFGARGIAPMGYAAFAFVLGVSVGMLVRRTLPAMVLTLAVFAALQLAMPLLVRPHLMPPITATFELGRTNVDSISIPGTAGRTRGSPWAWPYPARRAPGSWPTTCSTRPDV